MTFFPKKSHHGYFDTIFQRHFYDKKQKEAFMKKHSFVEGDSVSKTHMKRIKDLNAYIKEEKRKNPEFRFKEAYPN